MTRQRPTSKTGRKLCSSCMSVISIMRIPLLVLDDRLRCLFANSSFSGTFGVDTETIAGKAYDGIDDGLLAGTPLRHSLEDLLTEQIDFDGLNVELDLPRQGRRYFLVSGTGTVTDEGQRILVLNLEDVTDARNAEKTHRAREVKYETLFNSSSDAIMMLAPPQWRFIAGNPATLKIFRCRSEEEFVSLGPGDLSPPTQPNGENSSAKASKMIQKAMETGSNFFEWEHMRTDGERFPATVLLSRIELEGKILLQATVRDIGPRKRIEARLRAREARFRSLLENLPTVTYQCANDPEYTMSFISGEIEALTGYPPSDFIGNKVRAFSSIIHPDDLPMVQKMVEEALEARSAYTIDYRLVRRDRKVQWVFEKGQGVFDENDEFLFLDGIIFDNTEQKLLESERGKQRFQLEELVRSRTSELRESEEKYRTLVEQSHDGIYIYSDDRFRFINDGMSELTGYTKDALYTMEFLDLIHPEDRERMLEFDRTREAGGDAQFIYQIRILRRDGETRFVEFSVRALTYNDRYAMMGICRDISASKKYEEEQYKLQRLESLGILAGGIAHDFNNFLTGVMGNISLAKMLVEPGTRIHDILQNSERAATKASGLTRQLLTFSRGGEPIKAEFSLSDLISEACSFVLSGSNVSAELDIPDDLWSIIGDQTQLNQVVQNILLNADQAMPAGGTISISASNMVTNSRTLEPLAKGPYVQIRFLDSGPGIPEEVLPQIFDPFFSTKKTGSGLGLASTYSILKKHNGHITAGNASSGGLITVFIPASLGEAEDRRPEPGEGTEKHSGRVLVMDDKAMVRRTATAMLEHLNYEVETAKDGVEALSLYREAMDSTGPFDAVILDLTVPGGVGGREAITELLALDPSVRAIVSSGYSNDTVMANYKKHGFRGVVVKPYSISKLSYMMKEIMKD